MSQDSIPSKGIAILLALFLGGFGAHKFYLGRNRAGVLYLLFIWTFVPVILSLIDFMVMLGMSKDEWRSKYGN